MAPKKNSLPAETTTEEWRIMSAAVAFALWSAPSRAAQDMEADQADAEWDDAAADFRVRVRAVLRQAYGEGINVIEGDPVEANDPVSDSWMERSARVAWLFWLRKRRDNNQADPVSELNDWRFESESYRRYVREAFRQLRTQGIHLV